MLSDSEYNEAVKACSRERRNFMIPNKSIVHAEYLFKEIISVSREKICILTGSCDDKFYNKDSILSAFRSFINNTEGEGKIEIICEAEPDSGLKCEKFIKAIRKEYEKNKKPESLSLYQLTDNYPITNGNDVGKYVIHFIVVDNNGPFRYEKHSMRDKCSVPIEDSVDFTIEAKANFGNEVISESLQGSFDKLKNSKYTSKNNIPS